MVRSLAGLAHRWRASGMVAAVTTIAVTDNTITSAAPCWAISMAASITSANPATAQAIPR